MKDMIPAWVDGTLQPVEKLAAHVEGLRHRAVSVFLIHDDEILIQQRAPGKYHTPGLWANTCCTHPHWEEDPETCAIRRLEEELGITGVAPVWKDQIEYRADVGNGLIEHEVVDLYLVTTKDRPVLHLNPEEVDGVRWVSLADLEDEVSRHPERFTPWLRIYLSDHKLSVFGPT
ncbi:MAG: isopentenyl-diphosphate Delta-isomerase [Maritimibacter harenae]|jgi:isopentenyl-diphosphate delta-isomerase|uniref:Isopentenyl-diphosphate Delta-isomerase n=1 Tax=Maritimibacter harenae TaxID=2606218 RepID=A0A845LWD2_9RHOB|nr:isopentenyl-diphosphate Delta-isomerase [Maritimibacter harenae]MZR12105.1 isopentenyl-diphosphate Delta-isomerase [Maritimibacter harenae]